MQVRFANRKRCKHRWITLSWVIPNRRKSMNAEEIKAILTVSLLAAFADGNKHEREREEVRKIAQGLTGDEGIHLPSLYQDVLMKRVSVPDTVRALTSSEAKQLAYEMAVCVCDADGRHSPAEEQFLHSLRIELGLDAG